MECLQIETIPIDGVSRWVEVAKYRRIGETPKDVIRAYIESPQYGKSYLSAEEAGGGELHGPFPIHAIAPENYIPSSIKEFEGRIHWFCYEYPENPKYRVLDATVTTRLEELKQRIAHESGEVFRLNKDEAVKDPDIGWALLVFEEYLFVSNSTLVSVIIGED